MLALSPGFVLFILPRLAAVRFCCSCGISGVTLEQSHTTGKWVNVQFHWGKSLFKQKHEKTVWIKHGVTKGIDPVYVYIHTYIYVAYCMYTYVLNPSLLLVTSLKLLDFKDRSTAKVQRAAPVPWGKKTSSGLHICIIILLFLYLCIL